MLEVKKENYDVIKVTNNKSMTVELFTLGAAVYKISVPDRNGKVEAVTAHPISFKDYEGSPAYFGKVCGRTGGRIACGKALIGGKEYEVDNNEKGVTCLHGGFSALSEKVWKYSTSEDNDNYYVEFSCSSKAGECGFPANLKVFVTYEIAKEENTVSLRYEATSDGDTLVNLTNHTYFNLSGDVKRNVKDELLTLKADKFSDVDEKLIIKQMKEVDKTFDFRNGKRIGEDILAADEKYPVCHGYDHAFSFESADYTKANAVLYDEESGRELKIYTTYPAIVVYTCNYPTGSVVHGNKKITENDGICLECQYLPDGTRRGDDSTLLRSGDIFLENVKWTFSVRS